MAYEDELKHKIEIREQVRGNNREQSEPAPQNRGGAANGGLIYDLKGLNRIEEEIMSINRDLEEGNRNTVSSAASNRNYSSVA